MKSEASGITGRPRRRVRFWSAKACVKGGGTVSFLVFLRGEFFSNDGVRKKLYNHLHLSSNLLLRYRETSRRLQGWYC